MPQVHRLHMYRPPELIYLAVGIRFATLEITMVTAYFVASFDFQLVDQNGNRLFKVPDDDVNRRQVQLPKILPYVKFTTRDK